MFSTRKRGPVGSAGEVSERSWIAKSVAASDCFTFCSAIRGDLDHNGQAPRLVPVTWNRKPWTRVWSDALNQRRRLFMSELNVPARWGIEPSYYDVEGRERVAEPEALRRTIEALSGLGQPPMPPQLPEPQPSLAYQGDDRRVWVLAVQLYAVRSRR